MKRQCLTVVLILATLSAARGAEITLGKEINVGAGLGNQYQSDLRCNPLDTRQMLITSKLGNSETETIAFHTADGGLTWSSFREPASGDPDSVYDLDGWAHWSMISKSGGSKVTGYRRSKDGGKTWEPLRNLTAPIDHLHVTCDRSATSPHRNSLYIAGRLFSGGGIVVLRSRDGGETFQSTKVALSGSLGLGFVFAPVVLADGTLLIPMQTANKFLTDGRGWYAGNLKEIYCLRSSDGGLTFDSPIKIANKNSSPNNGPGGASCLGGMVAGPWGAGQRVYLTYPVDCENLPAALVLSSSDDGGKTWTTPRSIAPPAPAGWGAGSPSTMVNASGVLGVQWYSMQNDNTFDLYFTTSTDGGATFASPIRISSATSKEPPNQPRYPGQDQVYGDTAADGAFKLVWTDARNAAPTYTNFHRSVQVKATAPVTPAKLTVVGGSGSGTYEAGTAVAITAAPAPAGQEFASWTASAGLIVTPQTSSIAAVTVPAGGATVTATFRPQTLYGLTVVSGSGGGNYPAGATVTITANTVAGSVFVAWNGPDGVGMINPKSATTQLIMPARAVTMTATYNKIPTCSLTAPNAGLVYAPPAAITLNASAADTDGTIARVQFYAGATKLGEVTAAPYTFQWTSVPAGTYTLIAKAIDNQGAVGTSAAVTVSVTSSTPPMVSTAASASPSPVAGKTTTLSVLGADDGGEAALTYTWSATNAPAAVSFSANGTNAAKQTIATFMKAGSYTFTAAIKDASGLTTTSTVGVNVNQTLTSIVVTPGSASVNTGGTVQFAAAAKDQFGTAMNAAPTLTWTVSGGGTISAAGLFSAGATAGGPHTLTAASGGKTGTAAVTVTSGNAPPSVKIDAPAAGSSYFAPATVTIAASATDSNGTILKVEFFAGTTKIGESTISPYRVTWTNVAAGTYSLTAKATDNAGAATTSAAVGITVKTNAAPTIATAASASPAPVTAKTTTLRVIGADDGGETALLYSWSLTSGAAAVSFSANGTNAAKQTTATFTKAGSYAFAVTIKDASGLSATSMVSVNVNQTLSSIVVTPASASIAAGGSQQHAASSADQFGATLAVQPAFTWTVSGGGTISASGLFTAGTSVGGPFTVAAASGGRTGTATVSVTSSAANTPPRISIEAPVAGQTFTAPANILIKVNASDPDGSVTRVDFYKGSYTLGADTNGTDGWSYNWTNVSAGTYTIIVEATDDDGARTSYFITIKVVAPIAAAPQTSEQLMADVNEISTVSSFETETESTITFAPLLVSKLAATVSSDRPLKNKCQLSGALRETAAFNPNSALVNVAVGGVACTFLMDTRGRARNDSGTLQIRSSKDKKTATFKALLRIPGASAAWPNLPDSAGVFELPVVLSSVDRVWSATSIVRYVKKGPQIRLKQSTR